MLLQKHHGKRGRAKSTGVADYFAVLGIDSLLPPPEEGAGGARSGDVDVGSEGDGSGASEADETASPPPSASPPTVDEHADQDSVCGMRIHDGNDNEANDDEEYERSCSMQTVHAGNLSSGARTPRNSNLSKSSWPKASPKSSMSGSNAIAKRTASTNGNGNRRGSGLGTNFPNLGEGGAEKDEMKGEEQRLHEGRFRREIIQLALITKPSLSSSSSSAGSLGDLEEGWTRLDDVALPLLGGNFNARPRIHLAYRRRGHIFDKIDSGNDCGDADNAGEGHGHPQHYYTPGVADASLRYVKVRPSTIKNFEYYQGGKTQPDARGHPRQEPRQTADETQSMAQPPSSKPSVAAGLASGATKHLSSLARKAGLATAVGKEMAAGLANAVKSRTPVGDVVGTITISGNAKDDASTSHHAASASSTTAEAVAGASRDGPASSSRPHAQPRHLWTTGREGSFETDAGAGQFEDAQGDVRLWRSFDAEGSGSDIFSGLSNSGVNSSTVSGANSSAGGRNSSTGGEANLSTALSSPRSTSGGRRREHFFPDTPAMPQCTVGDKGSIEDDAQGKHAENVGTDGVVRKALHEMLPIPEGYDEWAVPDFCKVLHLPTPEMIRRQKEERHRQFWQRQRLDSRLPPQRPGSLRQPILVDRTHALPTPSTQAGFMSGGSGDDLASPESARASSAASLGSPSSIGMEAMYLSPETTAGPDLSALMPQTQVPLDSAFLPALVSSKAIPVLGDNGSQDGHDLGEEDAHVYIPILAVRRQRIGEEERFREDPAAVDIQITFFDKNGEPLPPQADEGDGDDEDFGRGSTMLMQNAAHADILQKSEWTPSADYTSLKNLDSTSLRNQAGQPLILLRRNRPNGFADLPFPARVLDRFPQKNYRDLPFPGEELPLFCHAQGIKLVRGTLRDMGLPKSFGFVVKNERGDSIYVSCLTFLEPLTRSWEQQLHRLSLRRRLTSLPHRAHYLKTLEQRRTLSSGNYLVAFNQKVSYTSKTITLLSRYPIWREFRRFLAHLHLLSGSASDIPIERNISHLLLSVPVPKPGGQCVLVPFSTMQEPMALVMPPRKDLPLVDLSYGRLFGALDVPTVVTVVLGFLCLERKVILISTRQALLLDCCELLKSLLFPFELCAPYVPHLTRPFMSCLEFPGATFVGIHDDRQADGLANFARESIPEDSIIVELDTGEINCDGNRYEKLKAAYQVIPVESRSSLIKEVEALCGDAGIVPGHEPLDHDGVDPAIECPTAPSKVADNFGTHDERRGQRHHHFEPLDDRAVRDNFLRFFCSVLGGYERFLVPPDASFLTSGNDWFDSSKFLAAAASNYKPYLGALVETQLFQSFIQRRTEASDVHCVLFDECLAEYHGSAVPYGRLSFGESGSQVEGHMNYNLLVDECATEPDLLLDDDEGSSFLANRSEAFNKSFGNDNDTATQASSGYADSTISDTPSLLFDKDITFAINASGDIVTIPSTAHLPPNARYLYYVDGNPSFPTKFDRRHFLPKEPEVLETQSSEVPPPILTRSEREREDALRLCNMTVSRRGPQKQHRCLWQLPKFMGSQFLGAWLMCIPNQISQSGLSINEKSKILLRALGALRTLRSHRRIVADEAAYRALIVACARCGTDRRVELMKLYGLMRTDGIFPNAVTLGQYTRAIAEGYSSVDVDGGGTKVGMQVVISSGRPLRQEGLNLEVLANNSILEESGLKWRARGNDANAVGAFQPPMRINHASVSEIGQGQPQTISPSKTFDTATTQRSVKTKRLWLPVTCSSSFRLECNGVKKTNDIRLFALWSRATVCKACSYIPLDEEIQSGWDVVHSKLETSSTVVCPRCSGTFVPLIGYEEMTVDELFDSAGTEDDHPCASQATDLDISGVTQDPDLLDLPPQLESTIKNGHESLPAMEPGRSGFVTYLSPQNLRIMLEELLLEFGEEVLDRDHLRMANPEVFFNLWWYSARFSLPLPLAVASLPNEKDFHDTPGACDEDDVCRNNEMYDCCAFVSWDKSVALHGCRSAAKAIVAAQALPFTSDRHLREKLFDNPNTDIPLLSFFNLQSYAQGDWDHPDFSEILVALVKACETRDLLPVVECVFERNQVRQEISGDAMRNSASNSLNGSFESAGTAGFSIGASTEASLGPMPIALDCYRTVLYLARYQCTTAFHAFFPTTLKTCKGYHFWCAQGTSPLPIFDRAFREAAESYGKQKKMLVPIPEVSDVALGFRSVFGHII